MIRVEKKRLRITVPRILGLVLVVVGLVMFYTDARLMSKYQSAKDLEYLKLDDIKEGMVVSGSFNRVRGTYENNNKNTFSGVNHSDMIGWDAQYDGYIIPLNSKNKKFINYLVSEKNADRKTIMQMTDEPSYEKVSFVGIVEKMPWNMDLEKAKDALKVKSIDKVSQKMNTQLAIKPLEDNTLIFHMIRDVIVAFCGGLVLIIFGDLSNIFNVRLETIENHATKIYDYSRLQGSITSLSTTYSEIQLTLRMLKKKYYGLFIKGLAFVILAVIFQLLYRSESQIIFLIFTIAFALAAVKEFLSWIINSIPAPKVLFVSYPLGYQMRNCKKNMEQIQDKIEK